MEPEGESCELAPAGFNFDANAFDFRSFNFNVNNTANALHPPQSYPYNDITPCGSFSVDEEQKALTPRATITDVTGLKYQYSPKKASPTLAERVPLMKEGQPTNEGYDQNFAYHMYMYKISEPPAGMQASATEYVFTGSEDAKAGSWITANTFIPVDILEKRLCGTVNERLAAYTQDWLTYCFDPRNKFTRGDKNIPVPQNLQAVLPQVPSNNITAWKKDWGTIYNGRHLGLRDAAGNHDNKKSCDFLYNLFSDSAGENYANFPQFIFKRWARVAYIAAIAAKPPWSILCRFWPWPKSWPDGEIKFIYDNPLMAESINRIKNDPNTPQGLKDAATKITNVGVNKLWQDIMMAAHKEATEVKGESVLKKYLGPTATFKSDLQIPNQEATWRANHRCLGSHPQGFFTIWVTSADYMKMAAQNYILPDVRDTYTSLNITQYQFDALTSAIPDCNSVVTVTPISKIRIDAATNHLRRPTQNAVMGNVKANDIAAGIWNLHGENPRRVAEWLHRSAYSYGGYMIDNSGTNIVSSQTTTNLVFGTYAANTSMIRYENYVKRMAQQKSLQLAADNGLQLKTALQNPNKPWFVPKLEYDWSFSFTLKDNAVTCKTGTVFQLFSKAFPTIIEAQLDKAFERQCFGGEGPFGNLVQLTDQFMLAALWMATQQH